MHPQRRRPRDGTGCTDRAILLSPNPVLRHSPGRACAQVLPFTPISEQLLSAAWVAEEYPVLAPAAATAAPGWLGFIYMDHAVSGCFASVLLRRSRCSDDRISIVTYNADPALCRRSSTKPPRGRRFRPWPPSTMATPGPTRSTGSRRAPERGLSCPVRPQGG